MKKIIKNTLIILPILALITSCKPSVDFESRPNCLFHMYKNNQNTCNKYTISRPNPIIQ